MALRSWLFIVWMFAASLVIGLAAIPFLLKREWSIALSKFWARTLLLGLTIFCGIKDRVLGEENLPSGGALVAANHQSMWETLRLTTLLDRPCFILKKELQHWPIFSWYCRANGFIFIDRAAGARTLRDMTKKARVRIDEGAQIVIFPEGTRSLPGEKVPFQPGVAALAKTLRIPTVPVRHDSGAFWKQPGPVKTPGTITMHIGRAILEASDRKTYLASLEAAINEEIGDHRP